MSIPTKLVFVRINGRRRKFCFSVSTGLLQRDESNIRPSGHEPDALPTELRCMVTLTGVEPATSALWARHSSVELQCIASVYPSNHLLTYLPTLSPYHTQLYIETSLTYSDRRNLTAMRCGLIPLYLQYACRETTSFSGIWNGSNPIISTILPRKPVLQGGMMRNRTSI